MSNPLDEFQQYNALADQLIEQATKEQLAETARLLALSVAHYKAAYGDLPANDLAESLESGQVTDEVASMLSSGMEQFIGILAGLMSGSLGDERGLVN